MTEDAFVRDLLRSLHVHERSCHGLVKAVSETDRSVGRGPIDLTTTTRTISGCTCWLQLPDGKIDD